MSDLESRSFSVLGLSPWPGQSVYLPFPRRLFWLTSFAIHDVKQIYSAILNTGRKTASSNKLMLLVVPGDLHVKKKRV